MMRFVWIPVALLTLPASLVGPQAALYVTRGSIAPAVGAALVPLALLLGVLVLTKPRHLALIATGVALAIAGLTASIGTASFQQAALLARGEALDGVTLADALQRGRKGTWVRLSDARVRSETTHSFHFVSGGDSRRGRSGTPTQTTVALAPITLATEVSNENTMFRNKPTGAIPLWACASDIWALQTWDSERQAVRGTMAPIEPHVFKSLDAELRPSQPTVAPGAGAIPPAPGYRPPVERKAPTLSVSPGAWCIHLDPALDATKARENAVGTALAFLSILPLFALGAIAVVLSKGK